MKAPDLMVLPRLPRDETGPVFGEPWHAQAFALALELHARGAFSWSEWAEALSQQLQGVGPADDGSRYYEYWLASLESLVETKALIAQDALAARRQAWEDAYRNTAHGRAVELPTEPSP